MAKNLQFPAGVISIYGRGVISLVSGNAEIQGYRLKPGIKQRIFAPNHSFPIQIKSDDIFILNVTPIPLESLAYSEWSYYKLEDKTFTEYLDGFYINPKYPELSYDQSKLEEIDGKIRHGTKLMIIGDKGSGKSTFSRFITNRILNRFPKVAYLDLDPGQPEHSFPRTISLTIIDSPILGPQEMNSNYKKYVYDLGVFVVLNNEIYQKGIEELMNMAPHDMPLVVNSLGFIFNAGVGIHVSFFKTIRPNIRVLMLRPNSPEIPVVYANSIEFNIKKIINESNKGVKPAALRELRFSTYLTRGIGLNAVQQPKVLKLQNIFFYFGKPVILTKVLNYCIGSMAFLLKSRDSNPFILLKRDQQNCLVKVLSNFTPKWVYGAALIRAVDIENGLLYVNTPVSIANIDVLHVFPEEFLPTVLHDYPTDITYSDALTLQKFI